MPNLYALGQALGGEALPTGTIVESGVWRNWRFMLTLCPSLADTGNVIPLEYVLTAATSFEPNDVLDGLDYSCGRIAIKLGGTTVVTWSSPAKDKIIRLKNKIFDQDQTLEENIDNV